MLQYLFTEARKATVAFGGTLITVAGASFWQAASDGQVTQSEWEQVIGSAVVAAVLSAYAVWQTRNVPAKA